MNNDERNIIGSLQKHSAQLPPDDYFATLRNDVMAKITNEAKIVPLYRKWWFLSSAAASIVFAIALTFLLNRETASGHAPDWKSVSREEMYAYVDNNISEFETEDLASQLDEIPSWNTTVSITGSPSPQSKEVEELFDELDKQDILEYLQEDVVEIDDAQLTGN